jgi:hypothetical protein
MSLLTQNSDLKRTDIYGWTLPAHWVELSDGTKFNACPNAGSCAAFCYAKFGMYQFSNVKESHRQKLELVLYRLQDFKAQMIAEIKSLRRKNKWIYIRIHDSGDFFSEEYAQAWLDIALECYHTIFYAYTKEVKLFKETLKTRIPKNFILIYSYGGKQDELIDPEVDRHSDVFTDYDKMIAEGYVDIEYDDRQAALNPNHRIGLYRNNIPHVVKKMKEKSFREWGHKRPKYAELKQENKRNAFEPEYGC